jgi:hypothetical protein
MNINNYSQESIQLEDIVLETAVVAMVRQDVAEISKKNNLVFEESFDDLDFLVYTTLSFSHRDSRVALICRRNAPVSGIEICVRHDEHPQNIALLVCKTLQELSLASEDLIWIHPNYQEDIHKLLEDDRGTNQFPRDESITGLTPIKSR